MKILAPLSQVDNYIPLVEAGADEFFAGIFPYEWIKEYNAVIPINRREYIFGNCNFSSYSSMETLSKLVKKYGVPVKLAFNSHYYLQEQYPILKEVIQKLMSLGFDTFIISDIALIKYLREQGVDCIIHLSGELQVLSEYSLRYLNQYKIGRLVFPRRARISDMEKVIKNAGEPNQEFEAFMLNSFCPFDGAFCNSLHCDEIKHLCWVKAAMNTFGEEEEKFSKVKEGIPQYLQSMQYSDEHTSDGGCEGCGLCAIKKLERIGITNLKVVGRGVPLEDIIRDIKMVKDVINISKTIDDDETFSKYVKDKYFNGDCSNRLCYYPED